LPESFGAVAPGPTSHWHLDEMAVMISGKQFWLWRAVDSEGEDLDVLVQRRRNKAANVLSYCGTATPLAGKRRGITETRASPTCPNLFPGREKLARRWHRCRSPSCSCGQGPARPGSSADYRCRQGRD
jgi:hypothetical protein